MKRRDNLLESSGRNTGSLRKSATTIRRKLSREWKNTRTARKRLLEKLQNTLGDVERELRRHAR